MDHNPLIRPAICRGAGGWWEKHFVRCVFFLGWWLVVGSGAVFLGLKSFFLAFALKKKGDRSIPGFGSEEKRLLFMLFEAALLGNLTWRGSSPHNNGTSPKNSTVSIGGATFPCLGGSLCAKFPKKTNASAVTATVTLCNCNWALKLIF